MVAAFEVHTSVALDNLVEVAVVVGTADRVAVVVVAMGVASYPLEVATYPLAVEVNKRMIAVTVDTLDLIQIDLVD